MTSGILVVDKPLHWTSFDVVRRVRTWTQEKRVGHTGTLDPMATGVLVVAVGRATRWIPFLLGGNKVYEASIHLGVETNTDDAAPESIVLQQAPPERVQALSMEQIKTALHGQEGMREQVPPLFSAKKIAGVRLYEQARQVDSWENTETLTALARQQTSKQKTIWIESIELLEVSLPILRIRVTCGAGTYIRSLARDVGKQLGVGGHLAALRRTQVGALSLREVTAGIDSSKPPPLRWVPSLQALSYLEQVQINAQETIRLQQGILLPSVIERLESTAPRPPSPDMPHPCVVLYDASANPAGAVTKEQNEWKIARVFL